MNDISSLTAVVLTYNEEIHLQRCIDSLKPVCKEIVIVDSYSTDSTKEIALKNDVRFYQNSWINHSVQFNWGLDNCNIATDWVLRIDADEYLSQGLQNEIKNKLPKIKSDVNGVILPLRRVFLGREIKRGTNGISLLRLFRFGKARCESRLMDEHIELVDGRTVEFKETFSDHNLNNIGWWTQKHIGYSIKEAVELLDIELGLFSIEKSRGKISSQALKKRNLKYRYATKPLFFRAFIYFLYRYLLKLGFLDGKEGFLWHFLQGWWYRTLVDVKIYEIKKYCGNDVDKIKSYIKTAYKIDL